jgi:hypothetical protein
LFGLVLGVRLSPRRPSFQGRLRWGIVQRGSFKNNFLDFNDVLITSYVFICEYRGAQVTFLDPHTADDAMHGPLRPLFVYSVTCGIVMMCLLAVSPLSLAESLPHPPNTTHRTQGRGHNTAAAGDADIQKKQPIIHYLQSHSSETQLSDAKKECTVQDQIKDH